MIHPILRITWISPLLVCLACSAAEGVGSSEPTTSAHSNELKAVEVAASSGVTPNVLSPKSIVKTPAGQISMGGMTSMGGMSSMGGITGMSGATGFAGTTGAGGSFGAGGTTSAGGSTSSCCDKCNTECPDIWICSEEDCRCQCRGSDEVTVQTL